MTYQRHNPKATCDICGFVKHMSVLKRTWDGYMACTDNDNCWYPKHPADSPMPIYKNEGMPVKNARPEQPDVFIDTDLHGLSTWDHIVDPQADNFGRIYWNAFHRKWGST